MEQVRSLTALSKDELVARVGELERKCVEKDDMIAHQAALNEAAHTEIARLRKALEALLTDMIIAQGNMRDAAKRDHRWEGCAEAIQPRVDAARAALDPQEKS